MFVINSLEEEKCTESQLDILLKINTGEYVLQKKKKRSSVWNVYREILRSDGSRLKWRYYCVGCKRVMQSTGGTTSNLRIHKCHVRYLKQNGNISADDAASPVTDSESPANRTDNERVPSTVESTRANRHRTYADQYEAFYNIKMTPKRQYNEMDDEINHLDEPDPVEEFANRPKVDLGMSSTDTRPLLKLFSEESCSGETEQQSPIVVESPVILEEFQRGTLQPNTTKCIQIDPSALSEAESYARSWAHAFLKLSEDQKFYAKRSIDELLVLGRLEKLNISTVTSLTTNL
ncbi:uncharacterized protein LOC108151550 isoform X2 [Drosophila miranda]|uniref:uncharacterized protein LOC108151550 isoform X2 n=1 Tax=Drosophila miranda TaxID=7229 RepID=UPI0007E7AE8E|nr:uncharacterized protein LOC108151550 isoform X2 [Drosophila miranda]